MLWQNLAALRVWSRFVLLVKHRVWPERLPKRPGESEEESDLSGEEEVDIEVRFAKHFSVLELLQNPCTDPDAVDEKCLSTE